MTTTKQLASLIKTIYGNFNPTQKEIDLDMEKTLDFEFEFENIDYKIYTHRNQGRKEFVATSRESEGFDVSGAIVKEHSLIDNFMNLHQKVKKKFKNMESHRNKRYIVTTIVKRDGRSIPNYCEITKISKNHYPLHRNTDGMELKIRNELNRITRDGTTKPKSVKTTNLNPGDTP